MNLPCNVANVVSGLLGTGFHQRESHFFVRTGMLVIDVYSCPLTLILRLYAFPCSPTKLDNGAEGSLV